MQISLFEDDDDAGAQVVNVASVPQRSPFRYPGGKTWFIPRLRQWLYSLPATPTVLVEPFAGGSIVALTAAFEHLAQSVLLVELDAEVAAVWQTVVDGNAPWLAQQITGFEMSLANLQSALAVECTSTQETAFRTILKNRTVHGGILAQGSGFLKQGEGGKGIASRWYPETLAKRLLDIHAIRDKIGFQHADAFTVLEMHQDREDVAFFIDPPYTAGGKSAGKRLYTHYELDHERLFALCAKMKGALIMTYDNADEVKDLAIKHGFMAKPIPMKNTHHAEMTELVIGKDLAWMTGVKRVAEPRVDYTAKRPSA